MNTDALVRIADAVEKIEECVGIGFAGLLIVSGCLFFLWVALRK